MAIKYVLNIHTGKFDATSVEDLSGYLTLDQTIPQSVINGAPLFNVGLKSPKIYPSTDSTTAVQINKADGTTNVLNVDTVNKEATLEDRPLIRYNFMGR
jgi:hypothetical protein